MLRYDFRSLDKLGEIKEKKCLAKESAVVSSSSALANTKPLDPTLANQLANFDSSDLMWLALSFVSDESWGSLGFLIRIVRIAKGNLSFP